MSMILLDFLGNFRQIFVYGNPDKLLPGNIKPASDSHQPMKTRGGRGYAKIDFFGDKCSEPAVSRCPHVWRRVHHVRPSFLPTKLFGACCCSL